MKTSEQQVRCADAADVGATAIGHRGFFREVSRATLWRETADWIRAVAAAPAARSAA